MKQQKLPRTFQLFKDKPCKFSRRCRFYSQLSVTCTSQGGSYCGVYRQLEAKPEAIRETVMFSLNRDLVEPVACEA